MSFGVTVFSQGQLKELGDNGAEFQVWDCTSWTHPVGLFWLPQKFIFRSWISWVASQLQLLVKRAYKPIYGTLGKYSGKSDCVYRTYSAK